MQHSYDYIIETVKLLSHGREISKKELVTNLRALNVQSPLVQRGIISVNFRHVEGTTRGRGTGFYRLSRPYDQLFVDDIAKCISPLTRYERSLYYQARNIRLTALDDIVIPVRRHYAEYSADKLLSLLFTLSCDSYTRYVDILNKSHTGECAARIIANMTDIGIVKNKYGLGYRLCRPLEKVYIGELLGYLCSNSQRRKHFNRLFYGLQTQTVSTLAIHKELK